VLILTPAFADDTAAAPASWDWVRSPDGAQVVARGSGPASELPSDADCTLVLPMRWVSWQRVQWPKVSSARLRAALDGLLEDRLLQDTERLHFALPAELRAGAATWVACCERQRLQQCLETLHQAGLSPTRIAPSLWPADPGAAVARTAAADGHHPWLSLATDSGCGHWPLGAAAPLLETLGLRERTVHWSADAVSVARADAALDVRCTIESNDSWLLRAAKSPWNLAQFEFSQSANRRRQQRWREAWRTLRHDHAWRPLRWGAVALVLVQLIGLNVHAWQLQRELQFIQAQQRQVLQAQFPSVTLVIDPVLQMQRELDLLRQRSGAVGSGDLESLLATLGQAATAEPWPGLSAIDHDASSTRLGVEAFGSAALGVWQARLQAAGLSVQTEDQSLVVRP